MGCLNLQALSLLAVKQQQLRLDSVAPQEPPSYTDGVCDNALISDLPFCNDSLSLDARVVDLVARIPLEDTFGLLVNNASPVKSVHLPAYEWWNEALHGVANSPGVHFEASTPVATSFPQVISVAAAFNRTLFYTLGEASKPIIAFGPQRAMSEEESLTASEPLAMEETFTHWSRYVEISYGESRVVAVVQDPDSFVLGTTVWDSSKTMLKFVEQHPELFRKFTSICELGAGCGGLAGIACAINNNGLSDVVMTDIGPVLPWLRRNVRANLSTKESERVRIEQHAWGTPVTNLSAPFDCILCADVLYEKKCVRPLVQSILALSHRKTVIYLANERRAPEVRAEFMRHLHEYFQWKEIPRSELDPGYIKEAIEMFEMRPKKRKIPEEMRIVVDENAPKDPTTEEYHPLFKGKAAESTEDPYDRDLWEDLLG